MGHHRTKGLVEGTKGTFFKTQGTTYQTKAEYKVPYAVEKKLVTSSLNDYAEAEAFENTILHG